MLSKLKKEKKKSSNFTRVIKNEMAFKIIVELVIDRY
jgi:hypothetical protein